MNKFSIKSTSRIFAITACFAFAGNALAQQVVHVDPNGSCMQWTFIDTSKKQAYTCSGESAIEDKITSRGRCRETMMPIGNYQFWYGGQHNIKLNIKASGDISFAEQSPQNIGLKITGNIIAFQLDSIELVKNGFPGVIGIEGEDVTLMNSTGDHNNGQGCVKATTPRNPLPMMKSAQFMVTGGWAKSPSGHLNGSSRFRLENGLLLPVWDSSNSAAFNGNKSGNTISPNPNYWLKARAHTSNKAEPIIAVKGKTCPTGFKV